MATRDQITTALLTEHLRYTPLTLLDDIINDVNELVFQAVNNIETALLNVPPDQLGFENPAPSQVSSNKRNAASSIASGANAETDEEALEQAARTEIEGGIVKLESLLNAAVDKDFDKLEIYTLRNLLTVSNSKDDEGLEDWIMLDHYKNLALDPQAPNVAYAPTPESLDQLRRKVAETEKLQSLLRIEKARNDALLSQLRPLLSSSSQEKPQQHRQPVKAEAREGSEEQATIPPSLSFLTSTPSAAALGIANSSTHSRATSMAQNTNFTYSQMANLRNIVKDLRPHLASLASPSSMAPLQIPKSEEERHAYIESQSKRAMERAGVEPQAGLGVQDEARRKVGADEVNALEGVVAALTSADQRQHEQGDRMEE
ncbi:hypothetical protein AAFC00_000218 [Neodothiora populina]|uniref:Uncharacterized protein n=1 Tax=Neodothiora populina TaxID=2781224 RepID=A0ABR3P241_9PEZI